MNIVCTSNIYVVYMYMQYKCTSRKQHMCCGHNSYILTVEDIWGGFDE